MHENVIHLAMETPIMQGTSRMLIGNDKFSTKSIWEELRQKQSNCGIFKDVWNSYLRPTISIFGWRLYVPK